MSDLNFTPGTSQAPGAVTLYSTLIRDIRSHSHVASPVKYDISALPNLYSPSKQAASALPSESRPPPVAANASIEEALFTNRYQLKVEFRKLLMYLNSKWQNVIFEQIDTLLGLDNWDEDSSLIKNDSFLTFVRFIIYAAPTRLPSLGVGPTGHLVASWRIADQRIVVEFRSADLCAATFVTDGAYGKIALSWLGHVADLRVFIDRNSMSSYLTNG